MGEPYTAFRSSFWVTYVTVNLVALFGVSLLLVTEVVLGDMTIRVEPLLVGIAAGSVVGAAMTAAAVAYFKTYVGPTTLKCTDAFGRYQTVTWGSIHTVRPINLGLLHYLRVRSDETEREIWVPLFLADMAGFAARVAEYAGDDHPLAEALAGYIDEV